MASTVPASDASQASRTASRAEAEAKANVAHDERCPSQAAKQVTYSDVLGSSFVVTAYFDVARRCALPRTLRALMLLPRTHLPLSCLDLLAPTGDFEGSRSYGSRLPALPLEVVLIARLESNNGPSMYALESQETGLFSLCKLGRWVDLAALGKSAVACCANLGITGMEGKRRVSGERLTTTVMLHRENKKRRLAIEAIQSLVKKPTRSLSGSGLVESDGASQLEASMTESPRPGFAVTPGDQESFTVVVAVGADMAIPDVAIPDEMAQAQTQTQIQSQALTSDDIFENTRNQYIETLYHSEGSLAYFAKGPLSRARAACNHVSQDDNLKTDNLIELMTRLTMTTAQIEKKYRETVPDLMAKLPLHDLDPGGEEEDGDGKCRKKRKKRVKQPKLGKDALYPGEDDHVRTWWRTHRPRYDDQAMTSTIRAQTNLQLSRLRSRETQLQMILILEVLALERAAKAAGTETDKNESSQAGAPPVHGAYSTKEEAPPRKRKKIDLSSLLDIYADRLSIWQSTALDDFGLLQDRPVSAPAQNTTDPSFQSQETATADPLKEFCVDIIIPFFSARLPERSDALNRKLGGPVIMASPLSTKKPSSKTKTKTTEPPPQPTKPGALTKRPKLTISNSGRTLERALSTEQSRRSLSREPSRTIALMRAASVPMAPPTIKREPSESGSSLSSLATLARRDQKEVRDAHVRAELNSAISTLRKPNRDVVGGVIMNEADSRRGASLAQLRKARKPVPYDFNQDQRQNVVVKATPMGLGRFRDALAVGQGNSGNARKSSGGVSRLSFRSDNGTEMDARGTKRGRDLAFASAESKIEVRKMGLDERSVEDRIIATPAKVRTVLHDIDPHDGSDEGVVASSPVALSPKMPQPAFVVRKRDVKGGRVSGMGLPSSASMPASPQTLAAVAVNASCGDQNSGEWEGGEKVERRDQLIAQLPEQEQEQEQKQRTIYEQLGWDDYDDDDM